MPTLDESLKENLSLSLSLLPSSYQRCFNLFGNIIDAPITQDTVN